jgi:ABC-type microcin C transport system duplicated ATPase subunit YejF
MVFQEPEAALNPVIRVGDQVAEVLRAHQEMSRQCARSEAKALLAQVGLYSGITNAYPHQLSGGQRPRSGSMSMPHVDSELQTLIFCAGTFCLRPQPWP